MARARVLAINSEHRMAEEKEEPIDLNKLSQRELLILCATDVRTLKKDFEKMKDEHQTMELKVNTLEAKSKVWGGIAGILTALATIIFERFVR